MIQDSVVYLNTGLFDTLNAAFKDTPGHTYYIAFLLNSNTGIYGFQMTALNDTNMAGSFVQSDFTHTYLQTSIANIQYISHHNASSFLNWAFYWKAPSSCEPVTFYYAYNLSDTLSLDTIIGGIKGIAGGAIYEGNVTIQCAVSGIEDINDKISGLQIFPNPASDQFSLSFALKQSGMVSLNVYSSDGKVVQNLMQDERREQGLFNSSFDISNLAPGIYLAKLSVGGASVTKKITKL